MIPETRTAEMASNGSSPGKMGEVGSVGIETWGGYIYEAYHTDLYWPTCYDLYNRIRRSDPEISIVRTLYNAMAHDVSLKWEMPEEPTPQDERVNEYLATLLEDIEGGQRQFIGTLVSNVPFMGWGWWEAVPGLRQHGWRGGDGWESEHNDGLVGFRKLAWRDHSSFESWDIDDNSGRLAGMVQHDPPNARVTIPLDRSIHIKFGDLDNPEGLSPLEAVWRLERIKVGFEVVAGIGFEHAAGHVKFTVMEELDAGAKATIRQAARAILTAQEGNYFTELEGKFTGSIMDVNFQAGPALLEFIRYYGLLKLQVYNMQWIAIASTAGGGAYSAMQDSSTMMLSMWNSMMSGFAEQIGEQLWKQAARYNPTLFAGTSARQKLIATPIEKEIPLGELAQLLPVLFQTVPMDDDDLIAIRRKLGFLSETLPEADESTEPKEVDMPDEETPPDDDDAELAELAEPEKAISGGPAIDISDEAIITVADVEEAMKRFKEYARKYDPGLEHLLEAEVVESEDDES